MKIFENFSFTAKIIDLFCGNTFQNLHISKIFCTFAPDLGAWHKQANRKIMADIEKSHHSQDLARVRTESFKTLLDDVRHIIEKGLQEAYQGVDMVMVNTYWQIGRRIVEEEQHGEKRASNELAQVVSSYKLRHG